MAAVAAAVAAVMTSSLQWAGKPGMNMSVMSVVNLSGLEPSY